MYYLSLSLYIYIYRPTTIKILELRVDHAKISVCAVQPARDGMFSIS